MMMMIKIKIIILLLFFLERFLIFYDDNDYVVNVHVVWYLRASNKNDVKFSVAFPIIIIIINVTITIIMVSVNTGGCYLSPH